MKKITRILVIGLLLVQMGSFANAQEMNETITIDIKELLDSPGAEWYGLIASFINEVDIENYKKIDYKAKGVLQLVGQSFSPKENNAHLESAVSIGIEKFIDKKSARGDFFEKQSPVNAIQKTKIKNIGTQSICFSTVQLSSDDGKIFKEEYFHNCIMQYKNIIISINFDFKINDENINKKAMKNMVNQFGKKILKKYYEKILKLETPA